MLIELLLNPIFLILDKLIDLIPSMSFLNGLGGISPLIEVFTYSSFIIPWDAFISCLGIAVAFYNVHFIMSIINFIIRKIPTIS